MTPQSTASAPVTRVGAALRRALPAGATYRAGRPMGETLPFRVNGQRLTARWIGEGRLAEVREIIEGAERPGIVVARFLSPGARAALSKAGIGWVDETGAAEIATQGLVIARTGSLPASRERPAAWTPATLSVAEALLCGTHPTVAATTRTTGLSEGACTNALRTLTRLGLLTADAPRGRASARRIADPDRFLDAYATAATAMRPETSLTLGVTWQDPIAGLTDLGHKLDKLGITWAATGLVAAAVAAPLITSVTTADIYLGAIGTAGLEVIARDVGLRPIEGGRLTVRPFPSRASAGLATTEGGLRVAPWPRLHADLRELGVRGEDAAEHLRETIRGR